MPDTQKENQNKLVKNILDFIVLQLLNTQPMHGYQIITQIRKTFGVTFGPSTIYPLLAALEQKGYLESHWNMEGQKPRKIYHLTREGNKILDFAETSLNRICGKLGNMRSSSPDFVEPTATFNDQTRPLWEPFRQPK
jgi:DNA-binding PadR family transcriptional regulator